jgi:Amt family ammonium transporter
VHLTAPRRAGRRHGLGPRKGKYGPDGRAARIPGHNLPLFGLGVLILWLGWFGFNGGLDARHGPATGFARHRRDEPGRRGGVITACIHGLLSPSAWTSAWPQRRHRGPRGHHRAVGLRRVLAAPIIGSSAGSSSSPASWRSTSSSTTRSGALSAHGLAGIWGTLACGLFTSPRLAESVGVGEPGLFYGGGSSSSARRPRRWR